MPRKNEIYGVLVLVALCVFFIAFTQREQILVPNSPGSLYRVRGIRFDPRLLYNGGYEDSINATMPTINDVVKHQKILIRRSLSTYKFPPGTKLRNFTLSTGGTPIRTVIITTWRSGSTFLGDVINALPGNFYHYEPLLDYGIVQIRGPPYADTALKNLKNLLSCDYANLQNYLEYGKSHVYLFTHNTRLWNLCEIYPDYCWNSTFLNGICREYPFQSMKLVRLRLRLAEELLKDESLINLKVLLLVRDPRGTLQSRKHREWCPGEPDCDKPNLLCADMVSDYSAAIYLTKLYPDRFRAIRYEDLSLDPYANVRDLFKFFGLHFHQTVKYFLDSHTKRDLGGVSSTFRDSKSAPFHWTRDLNFSEVQYIEENCDQAMKLWGYAKARDESHFKGEFFNPLTNYTIS